MARKNRRGPPEPATPTVEARKPRSRPLWGILFFVLGIVGAYYLWHYEPSSVPHLDTSANPAKVGVVGAYFSFGLFYLFGAVAWMAPFFLLWAGHAAFFPQRQRLRFSKLLWIVLALIASSLLATQLQGWSLIANHVNDSDPNHYPHGFGGLIGKSGYEGTLRGLLGPFPSALIMIGVLIVSAIGIFNVNLRENARKIWQRFLGIFQRNGASKPKAKAPKSSQTEEKEEESDLFGPPKDANGAPPPPPPAFKSKKTAFSVPSTGKSKPPLKVDAKKEAPAPAAGRDTTEVKIVESEKVERVKPHPPKAATNYVFPSTDLLSEPEALEGTQSAEEHLQVSEQLVAILDQFGVKVEAGEIHTGPVITRYEVKPAPGVRVEKIANLDKNIALGLKASSVRILAPVPGRGTVGIELPNRRPASVNLREIVESRAWVESKAEIPIALGKEVSGKPLVADLTKMPHLLIAGATGAGKTVCINSIVASLLYHASPDDLKFVMVDPKIVEMQIYNDLPHMMIPVVTEPRKVPAALKYLLREMEHRYQLFARASVRNIASFNNRKKKLSAEEEKEAEAAMSPEERAALNNVEVARDDEEPLPDKLPYVVCIVDELADLMMVAPAEVEQGIARLAQLARAAGIHLVVATQRPSVNVITGLIKANLPSRIAFKVAAKVDSRTILDGNGADQLIGRGDMLFLPPGSHDLLRAQGCFVSDDEINGLVAFLKKHNGEPAFDENFQAHVERSLEGDENGAAEQEDGDDADDSRLKRRAIEVLRTTKRASTSMLQRRLRIGYNRAARIMEELEEDGIVGPDNGSSPREILRDLDTL